MYIYIYIYSILISIQNIQCKVSTLCMLADNNQNIFKFRNKCLNYVYKYMHCFYLIITIFNGKQKKYNVFNIIIMY